MSTTTRRDYADGTSLTTRHPWGICVAARVMCPDGVVRATARISTADTFFPVPCAVKVKGKTVSGFLTVETREGLSTETDDDPAVVKFVASESGANASMLPGGAYRHRLGVPVDFPVRPLGPNDAVGRRVTCGTCNRSWDDAISTGWTPAPSGRCPFEYFH